MKRIGCTATVEGSPPCPCYTGRGMDTGLDAAKARLLDDLRRTIKNHRVLDAMKRVPREAFIPDASAHLAYEDIPLPIREGQTISQPLIVAMMTEALALKETSKVLEIGTGSGYEAAILSLLAREVVTIERFHALAEGARELLASLEYTNVWVRQVGAVLGCPEEAPFNGIIVTAGAPRLPRVLLDQLAEDGRLVIPVGSRQEQDLLLVEKAQDGYTLRSLGPCRFVPLVGSGAWAEDDGNGAEPVFL